MSHLDQGTEINGATLHDEMGAIIWQLANGEASLAPPFYLYPMVAPATVLRAQAPADIVVPATQTLTGAP